jgi:hypothetical protein
VRLTDRLSQPQRMVVVVALGAACAAAGAYLVNLGGNTATFGWYAYAPLTQAAALPHTGLPGWARLIVWLALTGLWALASIWVLRPSPKDSAGQ